MTCRNSMDHILLRRSIWFARCSARGSGHSNDKRCNFRQNRWPPSGFQLAFWHTVLAFPPTSFEQNHRYTAVSGNCSQWHCYPASWAIGSVHDTCININHLRFSHVRLLPGTCLTAAKQVSVHIHELSGLRLSCLCKVILRSQELSLLIHMHPSTCTLRKASLQTRPYAYRETLVVVLDCSPPSISIHLMRDMGNVYYDASSAGGQIWLASSAH